MSHAKQRHVNKGILLLSDQKKLLMMKATRRRPSFCGDDKLGKTTKYEGRLREKDQLKVRFKSRLSTILNAFEPFLSPELEVSIILTDCIIFFLC